MDDAVRRALDEDLTVDITTIGASTGHLRRIEIWLLGIDGRWFITGTPGPRSWLANLRREPSLRVHLKQQLHVDLVAVAHEVTDEATRRLVLEHPKAAWYRDQVPLERLMDEAPMVELTFAEERAHE